MYHVSLKLPYFKGKGQVLATQLLRRDSLVSNQECFAISEVAADWHKLMILQQTNWPSIARISERLDPLFAASRHTITPLSHTGPLPFGL